MFWISALIIVGIVSILIFSLRHSPRKIKDFPFVQFVYLFFSAPFMAVCLINMALLIYNRPAIVEDKLSDTIIFSIFIFSVVIGAIGIGIHSVAVTLLTEYSVHKGTKAYQFCERIHGLLSHQMTYINVMILFLLVIYLELNHPSNTVYGFRFLFGTGVLLGALTGVAMIFSTYINSYLKVNILIAITLVVLAVPVVSNVFKNHEIYPFAFISAIGLITLLITLVITWLVLRVVPDAVIRVEKKIFPQKYREIEVLESF